IDSPDTDGDGLSDGLEVLTHGCDPLRRDTDGDGLSDWEEVFLHGTRCDNPDTDGDGISDGVEVAQGTDPRQGAPPTAPPTAILTPSSAPTASLTPSVTPTGQPTTTPTMTGTPPATETPSATPSATPTSTATATSTVTPTPTATSEPAFVCYPTTPLVDGQLTQAIWANASRIQFAPAGSPDRPMTLALAQSGTIRFAGLTISDPVIEDTDAVRVYM